MFIYLALLIIILAIFKIEKNKNKALMFSFVLITLIAAFRRCDIGADTLQFYRDFSNIIADASWKYSNFRYEPGFYYLCKVLGLVTNNAQILIITTSIFINFSICKFIKKNSPDLCLSTILYIITLSFFSNMNIMRQALALAILLFGFEYLKEKKYVKYILIVLVASQFHTVAYASLLLLLFTILPNKRKVYFIEVIAAIVSFIFYKQLFNILTLGFGYSGYATSEFGVSNYFGAVLSALETFIIIGFLILFSYNKTDKDMSNKMKLCTIASILYMWFSFLVIRMNIFNRISELFSIYNIIFIPCLLEKMNKNNLYNYKIMKFFSISIYLASFLIISILRPEWHGVIPYYFFWQ